MSNVWDRTTEFLSDRLGSVTTVAILTIFLPMSVQQGLNGALVGITPGPALIGVQVVRLALSLVIMFGGLAIAALALDLVTGAGLAFGLAARRFLPALATLAALFVAFMLLCVPGGVMLGLSNVQFVQGKLAPMGPVQPGLIFGLAAYGFFVTIVVLWIGARLVLVNPTIVAEDRWLSAITRSWALTRRLTFKIIGVLILYLVVQWVAALATQTVFGSILRLLTRDDGALSTANVVTSVLTGAVTTAFTVLGCAFFAKLYLAVGGVAAGVPADLA